MKLDFGEVLGRMWKIGWNHKVLWLWQMLPGLFSIVVMPFMFVLNPAFAMLMPEPWNQYAQYANQGWFAVALVVMTFILIIPIMFAGVVAQLTTTYGAVKVDKGVEKLGFVELFRESLPYFWRVLGLYAIFGGAWMVIWFGFMVFFMFGSMLTFGLASICVMPLFLLLIPVLLVGASVLELAQTAVIADDMGTFNAIAHGWKLFRANWLGLVLLMLLLYFGMYLLSMIPAVPMMFLMMMMFPLGAELQGNIENFVPIFFFVVYPVLFILMYIIQGILMTFFQVAWAVVYIRLDRSANSPIVLEDKPQEAGL